ncbi:MAG: 2Fe-2S iron-sulfur cluster binding domain-containing protein [Thermoplasmata archaeon]|nr:2Fe-2S iron-sulfur cluster binding domain-containing protein [Thermoplasmata archaeon]
MTETDAECAKQDEGNPEEGTVEIFIMGKRYEVPIGFTIMKAIEFAGYQYIRSCGCRAGFCGACSTVYRKEDEQKLHFALACQALVEDGMHLVQIPFVPANKEKYDIHELKPDDNVLLSIYPEIARCVSCNTCTKSCPQDINVMQYIQCALRGDIEKAAEISFDCIQCGMCAMRCPADIKHYHVGQLARRLRGKYLDPDSENLKKCLEMLKSGKYDKEIEELVHMDNDKIIELYRARKIEAKGELDDEGGDGQ